VVQATEWRRTGSLLSGGGAVPALPTSGCYRDTAGFSFLSWEYCKREGEEMRTVSLNRIRTLVIGAGAVLALSAASPATAQEIKPADFSGCPVGLVCVYAGTNGNTVAGWKTFRATPSGSCTGFVISGLLGVHGALSAYNRTGVVQRIHRSLSCTGGNVRLADGSARENLGSEHFSIGGD
jgi:hypothetical protein